MWWRLRFQVNLILEKSKRVSTKEKQTGTGDKTHQTHHEKLTLKTDLIVFLCFSPYMSHDKKDK